MSIEASIRSKIVSSLHPEHLDLENESHKHGFSRGPEGHFKLLVVSEAFAGLNSVQRHQKIFAALSAEMSRGLHALAINALTPAAASPSGLSFVTPECAHPKK